MNEPNDTHATPQKAVSAPPAPPQGALCVQVVINPPAVPGGQAEPTINTTATPYETLMALNLAMSLMLAHVQDRTAPQEPPSRIIRLR